MELHFLGNLLFMFFFFKKGEFPCTHLYLLDWYLTMDRKVKNSSAIKACMSNIY